MLNPLGTNPFTFLKHGNYLVLGQRYFEKDVVLGHFDFRVKFVLNANFIQIEFLN